MIQINQQQDLAIERHVIARYRYHKAKWLNPQWTYQSPEHRKGMRIFRAEALQLRRKRLASQRLTCVPIGTLMSACNGPEINAALFEQHQRQWRK